MNKKFDCVEMKRQIQAKHIKLFKGLTAAEEASLMHEMILKDPVLPASGGRANGYLARRRRPRAGSDCRLRPLEGGNGVHRGKAF